MADSHTHHLRVHITVQTDDNRWHSTQVPISVSLVTEPAADEIFKLWQPDGSNADYPPHELDDPPAPGCACGAAPGECNHAPGYRGKWVPGGTTRTAQPVHVTVPNDGGQIHEHSIAAEPQPEDQLGTWGTNVDAQRLARRFAHAERHVPELLAQLNRLMSSQKFSWAEIKEKVRKRGEELAQEDPPDADLS